MDWITPFICGATGGFVVAIALRTRPDKTAPAPASAPTLEPAPPWCDNIRWSEYQLGDIVEVPMGIPGPLVVTASDRATHPSGAPECIPPRDMIVKRYRPVTENYGLAQGVLDAMLERQRLAERRSKEAGFTVDAICAAVRAQVDVLSLLDRWKGVIQAP